MSNPVATRGGGYGLDAELAKKLNDKYDVQAEGAARTWIAAVTGESGVQDSSQGFGQLLKNGQVLCKLINCIKPGQIKKIETSSMPFKQMENISQFLKAARALGVAEFDVFETVDLFDEKDLGGVVRCILSLSRAVQKTTPSFSGPFANYQSANVSTSNNSTASVNKAPLSPVVSSVSSSANAAHANDSSKSEIDSTVFTAYENMKLNDDSNAPSDSVQKASSIHASSAPVGSRGAGFGLDAELAQKKADKYDLKLEEEAKEWIESITSEKFDMPFAAKLKSGELLCKLINCIKPGTIPKVNQSTMPFKQMENISNFLKSCRSLGVSEHDLFETVDLYDEKDLGVVVLCIFALGRTVQVAVPDFKGPTLGPKQAEANRRTFTSDQLSAGKAAQSKISAGSSATMSRTHISTASSVTFGCDSVGLGDAGSISLINSGSSSSMERSEINASTSNITFGADAASGKLPNLGSK